MLKLSSLQKEFLSCKSTDRFSIVQIVAKKVFDLRCRPYLCLHKSPEYDDKSRNIIYPFTLVAQGAVCCGRFRCGGGEVGSRIACLGISRASGVCERSAASAAPRGGGGADRTARNGADQFTENAVLGVGRSGDPEAWRPWNVPSERLGAGVG